MTQDINRTTISNTIYQPIRLILPWAVACLLIGGATGWLLGTRSTNGQTELSVASTHDDINEAVDVQRANPAAPTPTRTPQSDNEVVIPAEAKVPSASNDVVETNAIPPAAPTPASLKAETITTLGDPEAPVMIVEFSDYQCPFCQRHFLETAPQIKSDYIDTGRVFYVFKDFPIASLHPLAYRLHEAALCVGDLNGSEAYWQVHDLFFAQAETFQQDNLVDMDRSILAALDEQGLASGAFQTCLSDNRFADQVQADLAEGQRLGVQGTPSFFIDGFPLSGARPFEQFQLAIGLAEEGTLAEAYVQQPTRATSSNPAQPVAAIEIGDAPTKGNADAPITIVEYSDYQCPFCLRHFNDTMPLLQTYIDNGQIQYAFKDYPLTRIHPQAPKAHEAARCARELGGEAMYWQMHDLLFANQQRWGSAPLPTHIQVLKEIAGEANLPQAEFDECLDSGRYTDEVNTGIGEGQGLGITGTPSFYINGQLMVGAQPFSVFQQTIESMLSAGTQ